MSYADPEPVINIHIAKAFFKSTSIPDPVVEHVFEYLQTASSFVKTIARSLQRVKTLSNGANCPAAMCYFTFKEDDDFVGRVGRLYYDRRRNAYIRVDSRRIYGLFIDVSKLTKEERRFAQKSVRNQIWGDRLWSDHSQSAIQNKCIVVQICGHSLKQSTGKRILGLCLHSCLSHAPLLVFAVGMLYGVWWKKLPLVLLNRKRFLFLMAKLVCELESSILDRRFDYYIRKGIEENVVSYNQVRSVMRLV